MGLVYCALVLAGLLFLWMVISPRSMWETLSAWQYKNPEANEPSEASFAMQRVAGAFGLIMMVVIGLVIAGQAEQSERNRQERQYADCLEENDDDEGLLSAEDWCENLSPSPEQP
ncbi:MAG: DUF6199 family natural product biosynthesis protein [Micromonosporaceae bacterium]